MQLIQMPRHYGKSTAIVRLMAADDNSMCIVVNPQLAEHMAGELYMYLSEHHPQKVIGSPRSFKDRFCTPSSWNRERLRKATKLYVDDIDIVLGQLLGAHVDVATYSPPQKWERLL